MPKSLDFANTVEMGDVDHRVAAFEEQINQDMLNLMDCPPVDKTSEKYKEAVLKAIKKAKKSV